MDLHAQTHALGFYERLGYTAYGAEFPEAGIAHRAMRRALTARTRIPGSVVGSGPADGTVSA